MQIDFNCDMGEGTGNDEQIMPYITSANIACGYHAGDENTIRSIVDLALKHGVNIGAHPSFDDKENFGRKEMHLPLQDVYALMIQQLVKMDSITKEKGATLYHIKPHGALYNMAAKDAAMSKTIATAVKDFNKNLVIYGLSGSFLICEAKAIGLKTANEVFADRTYDDDGNLTPRSQGGALIEDEEKALAQVLQMINEGSVISVSGKRVSIVAETICIHGDGKHALSFAKKISLITKPLRHYDTK